jgi:hypothetical protein
VTLPDAVRALALRLGADPDRVAGPVSLSQRGRMKLSLASARWLPFTAQQSIEVIACVFDWDARFLPFGYLAVIDALEAGRGRLEVTALGLIPLVRAKPTPALLRGEMLRYLAELPYAPDAMLHNRDLDWRETGAGQLVVGTGTGDLRCEVTLTLGEDGRVASIYAADRPRSATPPILPTPWHGRFSDYRQVQGRWLPFYGEVAWQIDGQQIPYWRGTLTAWAMPELAPQSEQGPGIAAVEPVVADAARGSAVPSA